VVDELVDRIDFDEVADRARRFLVAQAELFSRRIDEGFVRDGHGDLLADDIFCLDDGPRILDCLAFDDSLRIGDVLSDIGFLAMDLHRLAGPAAARSLLRWYHEYSNEHHPASLAHHYMAYRAHVRAKVAALRWQQGSASAADDVRVHHDVALAHLRRGEVRLVLVGGVPGSGKTTVASAVGTELGAVVLSTDELRKDLAQLGPDEHARAPVDRGLYTPERRAEVYDVLLAEAAQLLARGESVVLDASWSGLEQRGLAESVAGTHGVEMVAIECVVETDTAQRRIAERLTVPGVRSDATPEIADHMRSTWLPWPKAVQVDTSGPIAASTAAALRVVTGVPAPDDGET
jgi:predicted kinase